MNNGGKQHESDIPMSTTHVEARRRHACRRSLLDHQAQTSRLRTPQSSTMLTHPVTRHHSYQEALAKITSSLTGRTYPAEGM